MPTLLCAVALESWVSFLASVYLGRKKSMHSFLTAMVGTLLNILLNFLLIPRIGALGAAIATAAAYGAVLAVRAVDVKRIIPFHLCLPRLCVNIVLLLGAAAVMTLSPVGKIWWTLALTAATVAVNVPTLLASCKRLLQHRKG